MAYTTLTAAKQAYLENVNYDDGEGDIDKARSFRAACRSLIILLPSSSSNSSTSMSMDIKTVRDELNRVTDFLQVYDDTASRSAGRIMRIDFSEFRD